MKVFSMNKMLIFGFWSKSSAVLVLKMVKDRSKRVFNLVTQKLSLTLYNQTISKLFINHKKSN